uniref:Cystatin domain-containing protein n=1 Tax=Callorhinchus milii TaxID=7868 RepID=K4G0H2_CALMI|nr:hypothetical protein [Callorhinchus milii]
MFFSANMKLLGVLAVCTVLLMPCVMSQIHEAIPCDSQEVVALADLAVNHINEVEKQGYKFSLDRIENVQQLKKDGGENVYYIEIDVRETKCHILDPRPLSDCKIRPFLDTKVEGDCKVIVVTKAGAPSSVDGYRCELSPDSAEDVIEKCPNCPTLLLPNDTGVLYAVNVSLHKFNHVSNHMHKFQLRDITRASGKGVGSPVMVEFSIQETPCRKASPLCSLIALISPQNGFCAATVTPAGATAPEIVDVTCELYSTKVAPDSSTAPLEGESGTVASPEAATVAVVENNPTAASEVAISPGIMIPPKRKRAVQESFESFEELLIGTGQAGAGFEVLLKLSRFPDLPAHFTSCPGVRRHPKHL